MAITHSFIKTHPRISSARRRRTHACARAASRREI